MAFLRLSLVGTLDNCGAAALENVAYGTRIVNMLKIGRLPVHDSKTSGMTAIANFPQSDTTPQIHAYSNATLRGR